MNQRIGAVTLVAPDDQAGIDFHVGALGWGLIADIDQGHKQWVAVQHWFQGGPTRLVPGTGSPMHL